MVVKHNLVELVNYSICLLCKVTCVTVKKNNYIHPLKRPWMYLKAEIHQT